MAQLQKLHTGLADRPAIIFVHGLGGHPIDTWRHDSCTEQSFWLHWVGSDTQCDVWTLDYDAALSAWQDNAMPLPDQGDQVLDLLATNTGLANKQLVLVGHSMGGLVIKTVLISGSTKGDARFEALVNRVQGVVFLATPHGGAQLANIAKWAGFVLRTNVQVGDMTLHDAHLRTLTQQFRNHADKHHLSVRSFAETRGVKIAKGVFSFIGINSGPTMVVVDPASADPGIQGSTVVRLVEDHGSICKPDAVGKQVHASVCDFINTLPHLAAPIAPSATALPQSVAPSPSPPTAINVAPREPGRVTSPTDSRLQSREGRLYGRADDVAKVQQFLSGNDPTHPDVALVVGAAGEGKTEVCKAALKAWLAASPASVAYFVELPDLGSVADLVFRIGNAIGNPAVESLGQLQAQLPAALYYLDNLEGIADTPDGIAALRTLAQTPGIRLLASSRLKLATIFGEPIEIDRLPEADALRLFSELWNGAEALPDEAQLAKFVINKLGAHALSVTLVARLGDAYSFATVCKRWDEIGAALASDAQDDTRHGNLEVSLRLTAAALAPKHGTLALWTLAALFDEGLPDELLPQFEQAGGWPSARPHLVAHHVIKRRDGRWHMLPPLARFSLSASMKDADGFSWVACRAPVLDYFLRTAVVADGIATTNEQLAARRELIDLFTALCLAIEYEIQCTKRQSGWLDRIANNLVNTYQFRIGLSRELIVKMLPHLAKSAGPTHRLGDLERRLGRPDEARGLYEKALALYEKQQAGLGQANTLQSLGELERRLGRPDEARRLYEKALALFEKEQDGLGQANTLQSLGELGSQLGRLDEARKLLENALALFEKEHSGLGQANTLQSLGGLESRSGRPDEARRLYEKALALFEKEQAGLGQANTLQSLGELEYGLGRLDVARALYEQALALFENEQVGAGQVRSLQSLGELERHLGRLEEAQKLYERALALSERGQDGLGQANTLRSFGALHREARRYEEALRCYRQAADRYRTEQEPMGLAFTQVGIARCQSALGDANERDLALREALRAAEASGIDGVVQYVVAALVEVTGGKEQAQAWLAAHPV